MKMYFVHEVKKAKDNNPNFAGEIQEWYIGKGYVFLPSEIQRGICTGWKRKHFAEKYAEECRKYCELYWDSVECEVIEAEGIE